MHGDNVGGPIRWRMHLPVSPERVYDALNSDEGRASFWAETAIEHDGHIQFRFSSGYACRSKILERVPGRLFEIDYIGGPVSFELSPDGEGGTELFLVHRNIGSDEWNEVHAGWLNVLFPLKAWLAYGVDLRNHDPGRSWDQGYADQ
jgi:uncharacterized protein YndB with AHSA1/START domain